MVYYVDTQGLNDPELLSWPPLRVYQPDTGAQWLAIADLVYLKGELNYTWLYWADGRQILVPYTMKRIASKLPANWFIRLHRHYLVNRQFIDRVELLEIGPLIYLLTGTSLPASRRCWVVLRQQLKFRR